jgi:hypothetical protein
MSRDPANRPRSAGELIARLKEALAPEVTQAMAPPKPARTAAQPEAMRTAAQPELERTASRPEPSRSAPPPVSLDRAGRGRRAFIAALLALALVAAGLIVVLSAGGSGRSTTSAQRAPSRRSQRRGTTAGQRTTPTTSAASSAPASGSSASSLPASAPTGANASPAAGGGATNPVSAVESFYSASAAHEYGTAWALADPTFRNQLGGYDSFTAGQAADRSITFDAARVVSQSPTAATVAVQTTSVRTTGTQQCAGTVQLVNSGSGGWLLHLIDINCA